MSKYINVDTLIENLSVNPDECPGCPEPEFLPELIEILKETPAADVAPVVKCRDCRWWHDWNGECYAKEAQGFGHLWDADDYCSYGERIDEEAD